MAIIFSNEANGKESYGYSIWAVMKTQFHCYLEDINLRNIYRHLKDLEKAGLIKKSIKQGVENAPKRQLYSITENGRQLANRYTKYLQILQPLV